MALCVVACVQGCGCSWSCGGGVEKSRGVFLAGEHLVSARLIRRFCRACCFTSSSLHCTSPPPPLSWLPLLLPVSLCSSSTTVSSSSSSSSSSTGSREQQPLPPPPTPRKRNSRTAKNPSRRKGSSLQAAAAAGRMSASDLNLVAALHEFIAAGDLAPEQVPSTQELARSGRQDLANAVRRRGYKAVAQLLANPNFLRTASSANAAQAKPIESQGSIELDCTQHQDHHVRQKVQPGHSEQSPSRHDDVNGDLSSQQINGLSYQHEPSSFAPLPTTYSKSYSNMRTVLLDEGDQASQELLSQPNNVQLSRVAEKFKNGSSNGYSDVHAYEHSSEDEGRDDNRLGSTPNSGFSGPQDRMAWQKAAALKTKLQSFFSNPIDTTMLQKLRDREANFDSMAEEESLGSPSSLQEIQDIHDAPRIDPSTELDCIRASLHAKEMENLRVARELEEVKALLALIRAKAAAELAQAKQLAAEKDLQLQMAQQALLSLKMVHVEWWGKGSQVELAGSFNGWGHHLRMFPDLASEPQKRDGSSRGPMMWAVELWLYPGIYEIKFIVDGKWQTDHQREVVQHKLGPNNLLRVDP